VLPGVVLPGLIGESNPAPPPHLPSSPLFPQRGPHAAADIGRSGGGARRVRVPQRRPHTRPARGRRRGGRSRCRRRRGRQPRRAGRRGRQGVALLGQEVTPAAPRPSGACYRTRTAPPGWRAAQRAAQRPAQRANDGAAVDDHHPAAGSQSSSLDSPNIFLPRRPPWAPREAARGARKHGPRPGGGARPGAAASSDLGSLPGGRDQRRCRRRAGRGRRGPSRAGAAPSGAQSTLRSSIPTQTGHVIAEPLQPQATEAPRAGWGALLGPRRAAPRAALDGAPAVEPHGVAAPPADRARGRGQGRGRAS
jgi:hypothetical protein